MLRTFCALLLVSFAHTLLIPRSICANVHMMHVFTPQRVVNVPKQRSLGMSKFSSAYSTLLSVRGGNVELKPKSSRLHLIFDEGFGLKFALSLLMIGVIAKFPIVRSLLSHNYEGLRMIMLESAQRWKWWGAISLLASSCCALQVVLNFFSLGCAGFNTVLGPLRPPLLAMAFALQTTAWSEIRAQPLLWRKVSGGGRRGEYGEEYLFDNLSAL